MSPFAFLLFYIGAALMLLDAGLYSIGALGAIRSLVLWLACSFL